MREDAKRDIHIKLRRLGRLTSFIFFSMFPLRKKLSNLLVNLNRL